ncbi:HypC/HybG/HupF family hydrogenase formation chaperone [bacterium]|nr:HypC/HybG/HupF family hydrogenase formation chaperone [bacterium]
MCLAVPMQILSIDGETGVVEISGVKRNVGLQMIKDPRPGDYIIVHAGFAIQKLDEEEALETIALFREMEGLG